jgi:hypothetical protein
LTNDYLVFFNRGEREFFSVAVWDWL